MTNFLKRIVCRFKGHKIYIQSHFETKSLIAHCENNCGTHFVAQYVEVDEGGVHVRLIEF